MPPEPTDDQLMQRYSRGEPGAFDALYARHGRWLYALIARQSPLAAWVDDIYQDTLLAVTRSRETYTATAGFRTWLYQIARNRLIDMLRQHDPARWQQWQDDPDDIFDTIADPAPGPESQYSRQQQREALQQALAELPPAQREVFLLREHAELSLDEIGRLTGVSGETAKSRLRYAIARLASALAGRFA